MTVAECYKVLRLGPEASYDDVKKAFRQLAFALHPDLNPDNPHAARQFQRLNEAYVLLKDTLKNGPAPGTPGAAKARPTASQKQGAERYREQAAQGPKAGPGPTGTAKAAGKKKPKFYYKSEDVLKDILSDPFARKVYEDIYSSIKNRGGKPTAAPKIFKTRKATLRWGDKELNLDLTGGLSRAVKGWFRKQLDDEQTLYLEAAQLLPGNIIRIQISRPWAGKPVSVEVPLPPDYVIGRPLRLRGLGRHIGPLKGDLYLRLMAR